MALILILYFIISSTFRYVPLLPYALELGITFSFILLLTFKRYRFPKDVRWLILYAFAVMGYLLLAPAIVANYVHGQPLILGFVANRGVFLILVVLCFAFILFSKRVTFKSLEVTLVGLAWLNMILGGCTLLLLDPNEFSPEVFGNFISNGGGKFNQFNLPKGFTLLGAFYYFFQGFYLRKKKEKYFCLLMFSYVILGGNHRALLVALVLSLIIVIFWCRALSQASRIKLIFQIFGWVSLIFIAIMMFSPETILVRSASFSDALAVIGGATQVGDWSAGARIQQFSIGLSGIPDHPFFGHGHLSNSFNDGYGGLYGYFHPSDIGLVGVVFIFGGIGTLFLLCQYIFYFRFCGLALKTLRPKEDNSLLFAVVSMLVIHSINSFTSGMFAFYPERGLLWLFLIAVCFRNQSTYLPPSMVSRNGYKIVHATEGNDH